SLIAVPALFPPTIVVEQDMDNWREEAAAIKARLAVQHLALKALVQSHPDPGRLLDAWRNLQADSVTAAYAPAADSRHSEWLTARVQVLAEEWTQELERRRSASLAASAPHHRHRAWRPRARATDRRRPGLRR